MTTARASASLTAPGDPPDLSSFMDSALAGPPRSRLIRLGFALAKSSGVDALLSSVTDEVKWEKTNKRWLIGTQFALTEPDALRRIHDLSSSEAGAPRIQD